MARGRTARKADDDDGAIKDKDFSKAKSIYLGDVKPARSKASEFMQEVSTAMKAIKKVCFIQPKSFKDAIAIHEMEEAKMDDYLRGLVGQINEFKGRTVLTYHSNDLVDMAEGDKPAPTPRGKPKLVTIPAGTPSDGTETDLAGEDFDGPPPRVPPVED